MPVRKCPVLIESHQSPYLPASTPPPLSRYRSPFERWIGGPEDLSSHFEVCGYKVDVNTTTTGEARLTPLQTRFEPLGRVETRST